VKKSLRGPLVNYCHRGSRPEKNGLWDSRNCVHPYEKGAKRKNDEKNDPMNDPMNDEKSRDFGAIHCDANDGSDVHVAQASNF